MNKIAFRDLPLIVKVATALSLLSSWIIFEEVIVDRYGIWKVLPGYRVGFFCLWDFAALTTVIGGLAWLSRTNLKRIASRPAGHSIGPESHYN